MISTDTIRMAPPARLTAEGAVATKERRGAGVRKMLLGLGGDPDREGLAETPARLAGIHRGR